MSEELEHIWSRVRGQLARSLDEHTYRIWLEPLRARSFDDARLVLEAPPQACAWIHDRFGRLLQTSAAQVLGTGVLVELTPADGEQAAARQRTTRAGALTTEGRRATVQNPARVDKEPAAEQASAITNPKLTFEQFVIGDGNRLAHAAALAVAEMPAQAYNPLFICGPPGVGKTHLLCSIARFLQAHSPGQQVRCTTGEAFTNEFLLALGAGHTERFKSRFRHIDVLLVDDVQFLERKARTEEEFFHTFNALHDGGRQIVLTSDRLPHDLQALEDRLRERFQAGLVADVKPPDLGTRLAILRMRAHHDRITVADEEVLHEIAGRVQNNVRALEGALIRVVAFSSLTGRPLRAQLAREVLDGLYPSGAGPLSRSPCSISDIQAATCRRFGVSPQELLSPARAGRIAWPRQVAMYLARELTGQSLPAIGREFGGRDHTTVLHACRRASARINADAGARDMVRGLREELSARQART